MYMSATYNTLHCRNQLFSHACAIDDLFMMIWSEVEVMVEKGPEIEENEIICFDGLTHFFSVYDQQSTMMIARQPGWAMPHCINEDNNVDGDEKGWHGYWKCQELQFT